MYLYNNILTINRLKTDINEIDYHTKDPDALIFLKIQGND
jgi:hypothetical protein